MKKFLAKKQFWLLPVAMMLLLCVCVFQPVKAEAATTKTTTISISLGDGVNTDCPLEDLSAQQKAAVKVTVTILETGKSYTRSLKQLSSSNWRISYSSPSNAAYHAKITVDSSALQEYNYYLGGKVETTYPSTSTGGGVSVDNCVAPWACVTDESYVLPAGSSTTMNLEGVLKRTVAKLDVHVGFFSNSDLNYNNIPAYYLTLFEVNLYELQGNTYKRVWNGTLNSFRKNGGDLSVQVKPGTKYKVVVLTPPISGYNKGTGINWKDATTNTVIDPEGWLNKDYHTMLFYFTPVKSHTYDLRITNSFTEQLGPIYSPYYSK